MNENKFVKICGSLINLKYVSEICYNEGVIFYNCCGQYSGRSSSSFSNLNQFKTDIDNLIKAGILLI